MINPFLLHVGSGWYVEKVIIKTMEPPKQEKKKEKPPPKGAKGAKGKAKPEPAPEPEERIWYFEVNQWFDRGMVDKKILRTLVPGHMPEDKEPTPVPDVPEEPQGHLLWMLAVVSL